MYSHLFVKNRLGLSNAYFSNFYKKTALFSHGKADKVCLKPPNVLVLGFDATDIQKYVDYIEQCLAPNGYTVYPISPSKLVADPWMESTKAVVVLNSSLSIRYQLDNISIVLQKYLSLGGKVLSFLPTICGLVQIEQLPKNLPLSGKLILTLQNPNARKIEVDIKGLLKQVINIKNEEDNLMSVGANHEIKSVACYCNGQNNSIFSTLPLLEVGSLKDPQKQQILSYLFFRLGLESKWGVKGFNDVATDYEMLQHQAYLFATESSLQLKFLLNVYGSNALNAPFKAQGVQFLPASYAKDLLSCYESKSQVDVLFADAFNSNYSIYEKHSFDWLAYKRNLSSKRYGKVVVYGDVLPTTMTIFDGFLSKLFEDLGPVAIAKQQTKGQGRGGNKWLSPMGCAMFTIVVRIPINSHLGNALPFLQHIASVAVVLGIRNIPELEHVNLRVKWPNDIYFGDSIKLGGVVVKSTIFQDACIATIGCGVNISNNKPTACVNDIFKDDYGLKRQMTCEESIARTLSCLELLIDQFQNCGSEPFTKIYYKYWLHSNSEVSIELDGSTLLCTVVGIDEFGFLRARRHDNGVVVNLHPDGNSFNILKNLIVAKTT